MEAVVRKALAALEDVDDDVVEYVASMLEDGGSEEEHGETVREFIASATDCDEAVAAACAAEIFAALGPSDGSKAAADDESGDTAKLDVAVRMMDGLDLLVREARTFDHLETQEIAIKSLRAQRKAKRREERLLEDASQLERAVARELELATAAGAAGGEEDDDGDAAQGDQPLDCQLRNIDVPHKKGGGDVLSGGYLTLAAGRRYGLLGRNGCGKTTFLEWLAARPRDANSRGGGPLIPDRVSVLLVRQEIVGTRLSACETVIRSDARREGLKAAIAELEKPAHAKISSSLDALGRCYERLAARDEMRGAPGPRARKVLAGLGFDEARADTPTAHLSGGWRMRVSLACALFAAPSLLLLDEPTNHLDLEAVAWLERYLSRDFRGTLLTVSHDRSFLDAVCTDVVHFQPGGSLKQYRGDVANFEAVVAEDVARQSRQRDVQEKRRDGLQKYIDEHAKSGENGPKAAAQRKSKMKKMARLGVGSVEGRRYKASYDAPPDEVEEVAEAEKVVLDFPDPGPFDRAIVVASRASFSYPTAADAPPPAPGAPERRPLLADVDLSVDSRSRIALLGRNGCGKSTLVKLLVGDLQPDDGSVVVEPGAKIEYLAQHQLEQLDPLATPLDALRERYPGDGSNAHPLALRMHLARFGLGGDVLPHQKIHTLSGGQKCRVCLAAAMYRRPHLLVLDEPTNHLDMETTDALIAAIATFGGGVLVVSHDAHLCSKVCDTLLVVQDGAVARYDGTFKAYKKEVQAGKR